MVILGGPVQQAAQFEIVGVEDIAVQQHQLRSLNALEVVQAQAVDVDEFAGRRIVAFGGALFLQPVR